MPRKTHPNDAYFALTDEQLEEFNSLAHAHLKPIYPLLFEFLLLTGARLTEALRAPYPKKNDLYLKLLNIKRGQGTGIRLLPYATNPRLQALLETCKETNAVSFTGPFRNIKPRTVQHNARLIFDYMLLPFHSAHSFRHTFAVRLVKSGAPIYVIQRALGHQNINNTLRYLKPSVDDVMNAVINSY